jgi:hypothetical protein
VGVSRTFGDRSFYSLRSGPGQQIHGHADHMGLTYYARGRNLIVNAGHYGYANTAFGGLPRYRSIYVGQSPDLVLVLDRASGATSYQQLWHLDPSLRITTVTRSYAIASAPGTQL